MITTWQPSGKYARLLLVQLLQLRDRNLLDVVADTDEYGQRVYLIYTDGDRLAGIPFRPR